MSIDTRSTVLSVLLLSSAGAWAGADCPAAPQDQWMSRAEIQQSILARGYTIDRFKVADNCYEIYGRDAEGRKAEVYFNPVSGEIVKSEVDD